MKYRRPTSASRVGQDMRNTFDAATAADEDSDEEEEDKADVQATTAPPRPVRAMFDAASSVTDSDKSLRGNSCDASQPNCRLCPPDLPPH